jgi:hypothetical protein
MSRMITDEEIRCVMLSRDVHIFSQSHEGYRLLIASHHTTTPPAAFFCQSLEGIFSPGASVISLWTRWHSVPPSDRTGYKVSVNPVLSQFVTYNACSEHPCAQRSSDILHTCKA